MRLIVKYLKTTREVTIAADATFAALQQLLHEVFHITPRKQRLLIAGRGARGGVPDPATMLADCGVVDGTHIMLVGTVLANKGVSGTDTADRARLPGAQEYANPETLVVRRQEVQSHGGGGSGLYACSYSLGYICQNVYVCRTCITDGVAAPQHVLCSGCAVVCHAGHRLEVWGKRLNVRCDCCTATMENGVRPRGDAAPPASAPPCKFIAEQDTNEFPKLRLEPNEGNVYPALGPDGVTPQWCACDWKRHDCPDESHARPSAATDAAGSSSSSGSSEATSEEAGDDDGPVESCVACGHCFWATHLTNVNIDWVFDVGCYGEVKGELVFFHCHTCGVDCCLPCRLHCHFDHDCSPADLFVSPQSVFECGCRGGCAIAEGVTVEAAALCRAKVTAANFFKSAPPAAEDDTIRSDGRKVSRVMSCSDVASDNFLHYVCESCIAKNPWLIDFEAMRGCMGERLALPPTPTGSDAPTAAPVVPLYCCENEPEGQPQRHGAVIPNNLFSELACQCDACQNAFRVRLPGCACLDAPVELFFGTDRDCGNCGAGIVPGASSFVCVECELQSGSSLGGSYVLCASCHSNLAEVNHTPGHTFAEDSGDNLFRLFSASVVQQLDPDAQLWMVDHWQEAQGMFLDYVRDAFGSRRLRDCEGTSSDGTSSLRSSHRSSRR